MAATSRPSGQCATATVVKRAVRASGGTSPSSPSSLATLSGLAVARTSLTRPASRPPRGRFGEDLTLQRENLRDARLGDCEEVVELTPGERDALSGALHLDESPLTRHHDVHVDLRSHI